MPMDETQPIRVGLIGLGDFGRTFWAQARHIPALRISALCDSRAEELLGDLQRLTATPVELCNSSGEARDALARSSIPLVADGSLLAELGSDVVVEASGSPEAGASHARLALESGSHVTMVNKEAACTVGPALKRMAAARGLNFAMADGDQPRQVLDLLRWAETLGLDVICAGKAGDVDYAADDESDCWSPADAGKNLQEAAAERSRRIPASRRARFADLAEMAIVINESGLGWDTPTLHAPVLHYAEMASALRPRSEGGLLHTTPVVEVANLLTQAQVPSLAGGVFIVARARPDDDWSFLAGKRHLMSPDHRHLFLYRPFHLLGVETGMSVLRAARSDPDPGDAEARQRVDVICRAERHLEDGHVLAMDHGHRIAGVAAELASPSGLGLQDPMPYYLAAGRSLTRPVAQGQILLCGDFDDFTDCALARLRALG